MSWMGMIMYGQCGGQSEGVKRLQHGKGDICVAEVGVSVEYTMTGATSLSTSIDR